jgi:hypothetical protein
VTRSVRTLEYHATIRTWSQAGRVAQDERKVQGGQAERRTISGRIHVCSDSSRACGMEVTVCDLHGGPHGPAPYTAIHSSWRNRRGPGGRSASGPRRPGRLKGCAGCAVPPDNGRIEHAGLRSTTLRNLANQAGLKSDPWENERMRAKRCPVPISPEVRSTLILKSYACDRPCHQSEICVAATP